MLFRNKYRIGSKRLENWDYSKNGYYFITICTNKRECFFGKIQNNEMILNEIGKMAQQYWIEIPIHFKNTILDEFIIMPNHVHGILVVNDNLNGGHCRNVAMQRFYNGHFPFMSKISPKPHSISTIIRSFKSITSREIHKLNPEFEWQPRFYDHIIRNQKSLQNIKNYIKNNPSKWDNDRNNQGF